MVFRKVNYLYKKERMSSGVYKISNPKGKVYIGSSYNLEDRISNYKKGWAGRRQPKLFNSFIKYGICNHEFSIIEVCEKGETKNRERYWQEFHNVIGDRGLNCVLVESEGAPKIHTEATKKKISQALTGRIRGPLSEELKNLLSRIKKAKRPSKSYILELANTVSSMKDLGVLLKVSFSTLKDILEEYEIHEYLLRHWKEQTHKSMVLLILDHYEKTTTVDELSNIIKIGPQVIRRIIKKEGLRNQIYGKMSINKESRNSNGRQRT